MTEVLQTLSEGGENYKVQYEWKVLLLKNAL